MTQTLADRMTIRRCRGRGFATVFTLFVASFAFSARSTTAMTIEQQWECEANMVMEGSPMLADLDGNGSIELIQGDKTGKVHVFDALTGAPVWGTAGRRRVREPGRGRSERRHQPRDRHFHDQRQSVRDRQDRHGHLDI